MFCRGTILKFGVLLGLGFRGLGFRVSGLGGGTILKLGGVLLVSA